MCLYARVVFLCAHQRWGLCVKKCQTAENFQASKVDQDCLVKSPHVPTSRKLQRKCSSCIVMEDKFGKAKKSIEDVKQVLKRIGEDARKRKVEGEKKKEQEESKHVTTSLIFWETLLLSPGSSSAQLSHHRDAPIPRPRVGLPDMPPGGSIAVLFAEPILSDGSLGRGKKMRHSRVSQRPKA
ncbi:hypothetical protein FPOAC1_001201 [Fusarium poae]|uniref:hypothetical protein n=1 Tax=Fusarium poae TaxID=36050 RepID=UPI001CEB6DA1|nr:hypothetical protein FPOAC1_001201 [Fusarium poae]KAG8675223.1 hypothetical protein FPOAC1_001201 [Fusarium poae]